MDTALERAAGTPRPASVPPNGPTLLFDGVCNLCNGAVQFVLDHERDHELRFAALQSPEAKELLGDHPLPSGLDSVILVEGGEVFTHSDAALRVARHLGMPWRLLSAFRVVPRFVRDAVYRFIARHRYRWFGKSETCRIPTPELRARFLA